MLPRSPRSALALALTAIGMGATAPPALADAGDLDPTFAGTGYVESLFEPTAPSLTDLSGDRVAGVGEGCRCRLRGGGVRA